MELSIAPWLEVQTCYADAEDTEGLVYDLDEGEQLIHLAEGWTQEVEVAVAILLADLANDEPLRVVVGAGNSNNCVGFLGLADPDVVGGQTRGEPPDGVGTAGIPGGVVPSAGGQGIPGVGRPRQHQGAPHHCR